jgi:hypothetical protein
MKTSIEIVKAHQAWRTHKCESDSPHGCGKAGCVMPSHTSSELTKAIDDVIKSAERYQKLNSAFVRDEKILEKLKKKVG